VLKLKIEEKKRKKERKIMDRFNMPDGRKRKTREIKRKTILYIIKIDYLIIQIRIRIHIPVSGIISEYSERCINEMKQKTFVNYVNLIFKLHFFVT